jgi:hypothetical protein
VYLRNTTIDEYLTKTAGVKRIVHGTYSEPEKISALSAEHDIVINVGTSWDVALSEAIVAGLERRPAEKKTVLLHMSGAGNFVEKTWKDGSFHEGTKVWSVRSIHLTVRAQKSDKRQDNNVEDMKLLHPKMLNGGPDEVYVVQCSREDMPR